MPEDEAYLQRLRALGCDEEQLLLDEILTGGYDQGCFLRPDGEELVSASTPHAAEMFALLEQREKCHANGSDPREDSHASIGGEEPGFMIVTQRCDLLAGIRDEPLVELVRVRAVDRNSGEARSARLNSARLICVAEEGDVAWVADLRQRCMLPKDRLISHAARNIVSADSRARLRLRLGQRYSRDPLPNELVVKLQRPLVNKVIGHSKATLDLAGRFTEWLVHPDGDERYQLIAVIDEEHTQGEGDDAYEELSERFTPAINELLNDDSGAQKMEKLNFLLWATSLKLNLDEISWHEQKGRGHAEPSR